MQDVKGLNAALGFLLFSRMMFWCKILLVFGFLGFFFGPFLAGLVFFAGLPFFNDIIDFELVLLTVDDVVVELLDKVEFVVLLVDVVALVVLVLVLVVTAVLFVLVVVEEAINN